MQKTVLPLFIIALLMSSCGLISVFNDGKLQKPKIKYVSHKIVRAGAKSARVDVTLSAHNPNRIGLRDVVASYELFTGNKRFLKGNNLTFSLPPKKESPIVVPVEVIYRELFKATGSITKRIIKGEKHIPVRIKVFIEGKPVLYTEIGEGELFSFQHKIDKTIQVPIPYGKIKKALGGKLKRFLR